MGDIRYISTRGNSPAVSFAEAVTEGMVSSGGLFVPERIPQIDISALMGRSYQEIAIAVLTPFMGGFTDDEIAACVREAYTPDTFDIPEVTKMVNLGAWRHVAELWHGPTAAFKDIALQIMPQFMRYSKAKCADDSRTLILVATSGDTGKAALEGFRDKDGVSIAVFYPHGGVSEIQRMQMATTAGRNTTVVAVRGTFDDCQSAVKTLFGDRELRDMAARRGVKFSSANSINWGRLCPQIVYYVKSYLDLVASRDVVYGQEVDLCVPTGNFGNILAGYYAMEMGLPVHKLICVSNRNDVLTDFFRSGKYDKNREFYKTMSPSMDILVSSNLERFLFEVTGRDAERVSAWYDSLEKTGSFSVGAGLMQRKYGLIDARCVSEEAVLRTIGNVYKESNYVIDTHTAVAADTVAWYGGDAHGYRDNPVIITSTASPYKFAPSVLKGLGIEPKGDEFESIKTLFSSGAGPIHRAVDGLKEKKILHDKVIDIKEMRETVEQLL